MDIDDKGRGFDGLDPHDTFDIFDTKKMKKGTISTISKQISEDSERIEKINLEKKDSHTKEIDKLLKEEKKYNGKESKYKKYSPKIKEKHTNSESLSDSSGTDLSDSDYNKNLSSADSDSTDVFKRKRKKYSKSFGSEELEIKRQLIIQILRFKKINTHVQTPTLKMSIDELQIILDGLIDSESYERKRRTFRTFIKGIAFLIETVLLKTGYCNSLKDWYHSVAQNIDHYNPYFDEMVKPSYVKSKKSGKMKLVKKTNIVTLMSSNTTGGLFFQIIASAFMYSISNSLYTAGDDEIEGDDDDEKYFNKNFQTEEGL